MPARPCRPAVRWRSSGPGSGAAEAGLVEGVVPVNAPAEFEKISDDQARTIVAAYQDL